MADQKKPLAILNLSGELVPELAEYFSSRGITVVNPLSGMQNLDWTHIITKDINDFSQLNRKYQLIENDRHVISLSKVSDLQNFTANNGNVVIDEFWFKGPMGQLILDKYFQSYGGSTLTDNYPAFKELGSFNIVNPFHTGEYLDRMVNAAFSEGVEALSLKTYFDHLVMYLAGLRNKGRAGLPFEVVYGSYEDIFAIQLHFFSEKIQVTDVSKSLSSKLSKKAEEYYLNVAVQSSDFFDFSFMPEVQKVVVTSLWTKDKRITFENRGLMFTSLEGGVTLTQYANELSTSFLVTPEGEEDFTARIGLPEDQMSEVEVLIASGELTEEKIEQIVSGSDEDEIVSQLVKGGKLAEDEAQIIKGSDELQELVQHVKGKFDEQDKTVFKISGEKLDVDKVAFQIASTVDSSTKEKNMTVRNLGDSLPQSIKTGLFDFAKGINKEVQDLNDSELDRFQLQKLPEILRKELLKTAVENSVPQGAVPQAALKQLETKLQKMTAENDRLKNQQKTMMSEIRILKDSRKALAEIQSKASSATGGLALPPDPDEALRKEFQKKLSDAKNISEQDLKKLSSLLERESKMIEEMRKKDGELKRLELEGRQKESFFVQQLEKVERESKAKDLIVLKTKEGFQKMIEKKDKDIFDLKVKSDQLTKAVNSGLSRETEQKARDLEKQNQTLTKQVEMMKAKITSLATNLQPTKSEDNLKEEMRKLTIANQTMKNQLDLSKKEVEKLQARVSAESTEINNLKTEKNKLELELKKAAMAIKETTISNSKGQDQEQELKKALADKQALEAQLRESSKKLTDLESKLAEAMKTQKVTSTTGGDDSKKVVQLEATVKKLTQDLVTTKNEVAEAKKEINKARQEKTALQNQLDKMKKEADKSKQAAAAKKPGGKAA